MVDEGSVDAGGVGIELVVGRGVSVGQDEGEGGEGEDYAPARGGEGAPWRGWRVARVTAVGQDALDSAARLVGRQVGAVVRQALVGMDGEDLGGVTAAGLRASSVQLTFGVKLTAGVGKAIEAIVTAGGEASVQVVVTLDRPS